MDHVANLYISTLNLTQGNFVKKATVPQSNLTLTMNPMLH